MTDDDHPFELSSADAAGQLDIGVAMNEALHTEPTWCWWARSVTQQARARQG